MLKTNHKKPWLLLAALITFISVSYGQTSWRGTTSTSWSTASNWTNGVPTATTDVIIGDANVTRYPTINLTATCKNLTIGGSFAVMLTATKNITVTGNLLINANGTLKQGNTNVITLQGNWTNNGAYSTPATVIFAGTGNQTINGNNSFKKLQVNTGSTILLNAGITVSSTMTVNGTFNPNESPTYLVSGYKIVVGASGVLKVNASTLIGNYTYSIFTLNSGSTVDYSATAVTQTVSNAPTYSTLKISGSGIKQLGSSLPSLKSSSSSTGNIYVTSGIFDLQGFTANRGTSSTGGTISVSNGATIKIGGTNSFPINYASISLSLTSNTEYNGAAQTVTALTYGNLKLSSSSGAVIKTGPVTAFTVSGNFVTAIGAGSGVTYNAGSNMTISGNDTIGAATTFNGGNYAHAIGNNWNNSGTYTPGTSTINMNGPGATISGSSAQTFYNLNLNASNITCSSTSLTVSGNLATTGSGTFTHNTGGALTMSGTSKTISGTGIIVDNLTVSGTVTTASTLTIRGNLSVAGSFTASAGNITMSGTSKTISGAGAIGFYGLLATGTITTASSFSVSSALDVSGSFTASANTATFTGSATLNGTANLYNVNLNGTTLILSTNSVLGIANNFTITAGTFNVTSAIPNSVIYNGSGAQTVTATTYHRLTLTNGGTKTAGGAISANGILTIDPSTTFNASSYTHTLYSYFTNNGTFTAGTSTMAFAGTANAIISGATTFNTLTINKSSSSNTVTLSNNETAATVNMTLGQIKTGTNTLNITNTRTGTGIIMGNIQRTHSFTTGTAYAFESPDNSITFASVSGVSTVTVSVSQTTITDFPFGSAINREYTVNVPSGTYNATLRLHYEDGELNGNTESALVLWDYSGGTWINAGQSTRNSTSNYVEQSGLTSINNRWTCSNIPAVFRWNGSVSNAWNTAGNWTLIQGAGSVPSANDVVQIGQVSITNQPTISTAVSIKNIEFGSAAAAVLTLASGGSLTTAGNISGNWTANATHTINVGAQNLTVNGSLILSDGTSGHAINLNASTGTVSITGSLTESGGANVTLTGAAAIHIGGDFTYSSGTFTAGSSTVYFDGADAQAIGAVTYNNLTSDKATGISLISSATTINGNLNVLNGEIDVFAATTVTGNLSVNPAAKLRSSSATISIAGNLSNTGTFIPGSGTITFIGTGSQTISLATFYNIIVNKPSGAATFTGNIDVYGDFTIQSGNIDLGVYSANRTSQGGTFTLAAGTSLTVGGAANFPASYSTYNLDATSSVIYNGTVAQNVNGVDYGSLVLTNGGSNAKTLTGTATVNSDITINSGATLNGDVYTINLGGNWNNSGTFVPATGAVLLNGTGKTVNGNTTFNKLTVYGSYTVTGADVTYNGALNITSSGSYTAGSGIATVNGDLTNSGALTSTGTTTFTGTTVQTLRLLNAIASTSTGVINFNGTVPPVLNSTSAPTFATLNINNTGGINPSVDWTVFIGFNVGSGAIFNGGVSTHTFYGSFVNNGTVTSDGVLNFLPSSSKTYTLKGTNFTSNGTVVFGGTGAIATVGTPNTLTNVIVSNSAGLTPGSGWTMDGDFTITSAGVFNAGSYSYTVAGDLSSGGTLNGGTSNFTMSGTVPNEISGSPQTTFYDYTVTGSIVANSDFNIAHNFTNNNLFDALVGNPIFIGSLAGTIGGTATPFTLAQFEIKKTAGTTVTLTKNIVGMLSGDITSGTLDASTFTIDEIAGGGEFNVYDVSVFKIGGTNTLPSFSKYTLDSLSTVEYTGSAQTISSVSAFGIAYGNLTMSAAGTKTANGPLNIRNNFTLTNGTFVAGSYIDTLGGNWSMASGAYTNTGSTVTLNGTDVQDISSTGAFNNMIIKKTAGNTTLSSNITVNGTLTFTSGKIQTGSNTVIMPANAIVSGAAQGTGWVNGKLQKNFTTGSNVSRTLEIGGSTYYSPATILIASVGTAGNITGSVTVSDHPNIATSSINSAKSVNRYWSFSNSGTVFTNAAITVNWVASDLDAGVTTSAFKVGNYNGGSWTLPTVASPLSTSIQATGVTAFGDLAVGEVFSTATWTGGTSTNWGVTTNWSPATLPGASTAVTIPTGLTNYPLLNSGTGTVNNLTIQTGASVTVTGATLQIGGSISNSGTFTASAGTIELNGGSAQTIAGSMFATKAIQNLIISNAAGVNVSSTANDSLIITGTVSFGNVDNAVLATGNNITLRSNAAGTARVADLTNAGVNSGNSISGNVTVERYIKLRTGGTGRAYRLLAPTVNTTGSIKANWMEGQMNTAIGTNVNTYPGYGTQISGSGGNTNGFDKTQSNQASLYLTTNGTTLNYTSVANTSGTLNALTGYFLFVRGDRSADMTLPATTAMPTSATTLRTTGTLLQGTQNSFTNAFSGTAGTLNLVTNPYASPIDWSLVYAASTNISTSYTFWDPNFGTRGGFVTVNTSGTASSGAATKYIQSGQAFFVQSTGGTPTVSIQEIHKASGNNNGVFRLSSTPATFRTSLYFTQSDGYRRIADGVVAVYDDGNNAAVDGDDAIEINNWDENIAITREGKHLAIESRPTIQNKDTLPLFMNNMKQQNYELEFEPVDFVNTALKAELIDNYTGTRTLLSVLSTTVVPITVNADPASSAANRFTVVFGAVAPLPVTFTSIKAYQSAGGNGQLANVTVEWKVAAQVNIQKYEVERSADGINFGKIGTQMAAGANGSDASYNWLDQNPISGDNFYRVRSIGIGGDTKYSSIVKVNIKKGNPSITVYPNPVVGKIMHLQFADMEKGVYQLRLVSIGGQVMMSKQINFNGGNGMQMVELGEMATGNYRLEILKPGGERVVKEIMIKN